MTNAVCGETMKLEAIAALNGFARTGLRGFAQKAWDRLREAGMTERTVGRVEEWDADFARELAEYLQQD
jgi:hypothetical protein